MTMPAISGKWIALSAAAFLAAALASASAKAASLDRSQIEIKLVQVTANPPAHKIVDAPVIADTLERATLAPGAYALSATAYAVGAEATQALWYGEAGKQVSGAYSKKTSFANVPGIGHERYAVAADGGALVIAVAGFRNKLPQPVRVALLDADNVLKAAKGRWPRTPAEMRDVISKSPQSVALNVAAAPPQLLRVEGAPAGKRFVIVVGAEAILNSPSHRIAPAQALIANLSQFPSEIQNLVAPQASAKAPVINTAPLFESRKN